MKDWKFALFLTALLWGLLLVSQPVADFVLAIPHQFTSKNAQILRVVSPELKNQLDHSVTQGDFADDRTSGVSYSSFYDVENRAYFYRIRNRTNREFYVRSKIFLILLSQPVVHFSPAETLYVRLNDLGPPFIREEWVYLSDSKYPMYGQTGGTLEFVMPLERSRHPLIWKPRY